MDEAEEDDYIARLVEREIALARAMGGGEDFCPVDDPMAKYVPWVFLAAILFAVVATGASLLAVILA